MEKTSIILLVALIFLAACHKDEEESPAPETAQAPKIQIMTVFAPGQLGDQGYADRVMKGVNTLQNDTTTNADVEFMTSYDIETLQQTLLTWAAENTTVRDGAPYSRRLLVMTELYMAKWFATMTGALQDGDEILLLKATEADVEKAAEIIGDKIPIYALNISAASSVKKYAQTYLDLLAACNVPDHPRNIGIYRLYSQGTGLYRDSVAEAIQETLSLDAPPTAQNILTQEGQLYNTETFRTAFEQAYTTCTAQIIQRAHADRYDIFSIIDFGSSNSGANLYLMGQNNDNKILPIMLDGEKSYHLNRFAITRHFDKAIEQWLRRWTQQEPATMPKSETHGGWDGYCTEYIDKLDVKTKIDELNENN